jgi:processive 1,2-diacylglycerol beta-glucosyltransferase
MKILILSCNTGEGHNSSAKALQTALKRRGVECDIEDTLALSSQWLSRAISDLYNISIRTSLFGITYRLAQRYSALHLKSKSPVYVFNWLYAERLAQLIEQGHYNGVICVHLFPAEAITRIRRRRGQYIPTIFVMTDYTCIPFLDETDLDSYVIPHEHLIEEFAENGIPRSKLHPFGIPVDKTFHSWRSKEEARREAAEAFGWDIPLQSNWFLVMTGSMGFGNTQSIIDETISQSFDSTEIIAVCGRNEEMLQHLKEENRHIRTVHPIGFTDKIPLLMDACDVLFTKPGGISSTEAMSKQIPIIHTAPIPGCETRNAEFFHYHGMSYSCTDPAQQVRTALRLCNDAEFRKTMTGAQKLNARPDTCQNILGLFRGRVS